MIKVVIDSSVTVKWLNQKDEKNLQQAELLFLKAVKDNAIQLLAPELTKYEVGNVLSVAKKLEDKLLSESLRFFYSIPIKFIKDSLELSQITTKIVKDYNVTYYDAAFLSVAKQESATLITDNPKHQSKIKGVKVVALKDYK